MFSSAFKAGGEGRIFIKDSDSGRAVNGALSKNQKNPTALPNLNTDSGYKVTDSRVFRCCYIPVGISATVATMEQCSWGPGKPTAPGPARDCRESRLLEPFVKLRVQGLRQALGEARMGQHFGITV
ncbi:hypothetical protein KIL84_004812 [Mauremys mutica]|uniref:Uncharacterized protein n=1 Tax=Mauremys mutica TaxID=74926 RepID=A0A9D3XQE3_9SAUR|nr:hypothetical protein KIL84_004812 [Mauremys mutica]